MERITIEVIRRDRSKSVQVRGVWQPFDGITRRSPTRTVALPDEKTARLDEAALYEILGSIEAEIRGWTAKLPLDYA